MTITIEEIQTQISQLQKLLDSMKDPVLEVSRNFTGQYFKPYQGKQYRRMESSGIPIWECFIELKKDWYLLDKIESTKFEDLYSNISTKENEDPVEIIQIEE